jgi:BASS family bile acid:Na+ symporter
MAPVHAVVTAVVAVYLASTMFALGLEIGGAPKETKEQSREKWHLVARGLVVNLLVLPLLTFGTVRALHASSVIATALILLVASPGGGFAPHLVRIGGGDVPLAVELAILLGKITGFTAVPTAKWMLTLKTLEIRDLRFLAEILLVLFVPMLLGKWLRRRHRATGDRWLRPARRFAVGMALVTFVVVLVKADEGVRRLLVAHGHGWIAVAVVGLAGPLVAWIAGGRHVGARRTFSIGANARDCALALMMASVAFPQSAIHQAIVGIWSVYALTGLLIALGMRTFGRTPARGTTGFHGREAHGQA